jgi:hypothetical protein
MHSYILIEAPEGIIIFAAIFATQDYRLKKQMIAVAII